VPTTRSAALTKFARIEVQKMADSNLPQFADPFFQLLFDNVFDRQIKFTDRLLAEALLRECLKEERCPDTEN
jgi:hypothetical protein